MQEAKIEQHYDAFLQQNMTRKALAELQQRFMKTDFFLRICEQLGVTKAGDILELSAAIRKL